MTRANLAVNPQSNQSEVIRFRVPQCQHCGAKNIIAGPESATNPVLVCPQCGEHPGFVSSYGLCTHNPRHHYSQRGQCVKMQAKARKRVRHNVTSSELPHLWFHKAQDSAKASNMFFEGDTIYSYGRHFPIARHVETKTGRRAVLFTTRKYSVTTSGHCSGVRSAIPSNALVFNVPNVADHWGEGIPHQSNLKAYVEDITAELLKSARARGSNNKTWYHARARSLRAEAFKYCQFFRVKPETKIPDVPKLNSKALAEIKTREAKRVADLAAKTAHENAEVIEKWRAGDSYVRLPYSIAAMLRISSDGRNVETSRGVNFPISHAKRGLALVRACIARGENWETNGHTCHLGHYRLEKIDVTGRTVTAGCHVVSFDEIERVAPAIEAYTAPASETETPSAQ